MFLIVASLLPTPNKNVDATVSFGVSLILFHLLFKSPNCFQSQLPPISSAFFSIQPRGSHFWNACLLDIPQPVQSTPTAPRRSPTVRAHHCSFLWLPHPPSQPPLCHCHTDNWGSCYCHCAAEPQSHTQISVQGIRCEQGLGVKHPFLGSADYTSL